MNRPAGLVRLAGAPPVAVVLLLGSAVAILGWYEGSGPWWLALGAIAAAMHTLSAVGQVRRYREWLAQWQAMGAPLHAPPKPAAKPKRRWKLVTIAVLLLLVIPSLMPDKGYDEGPVMALTCLWLTDALYLLCRLFALMRRGFTRSTVRSTDRRQASAETAPVAWLLGPASSSPSRADAVQNLPEYSARLLSR
jgi:membrane protein YdbS with pleckstrin-like domain